MPFGDDEVVPVPPTCPDCGIPFLAAAVEETRYLICPTCSLVRLLPFPACGHWPAQADGLVMQ